MTIFDRGENFPYEVSHAPEFVEGGDDEIDADVVEVSVPNFTEEFALRGIMENHRRGVDVLCDIVKPPAADHLAIAEDALAASHLGMKEFGAHGIPFARAAKGTANGGEQDLRHLKRPPPKRLNHLEKNLTTKQPAAQERWRKRASASF
jgi:hypothetical protein